MALHGSVNVGSHAVLYWSAQNQGDKKANAAGHLYKCELFSPGHHPRRFWLRHNRHDGAAALAALVLQRARDYPVGGAIDFGPIDEDEATVDPERLREVRRYINHMRRMQADTPSEPEPHDP